LLHTPLIFYGLSWNALDAVCRILRFVVEWPIAVWQSVNRGNQARSAASAGMLGLVPFWISWDAPGEVPDPGVVKAGTPQPTP
jgi:hypothetical protein